MYTRYNTSKQKNTVKEIFKAYKKRKAEKVAITINTLSSLFLLWLLASYIDVITHNISSYTYAWWNLIAMFF